MNSLKSLVSNIEKENVLEEKKFRQLRTNPQSVSFQVKYPVVQKDYSNEELQKRLAQTCRDIGDIQKSSTNVQASMTGWYMHETNSDFMEVCRMAIELAYDNSPRQGVPLMPYDCWGAIYSKGNYTKTHEHWPQIWSWVYNVECCEKCSPLAFNDSLRYDSSHSIFPKSGNMILFPGWIRHSVPEHQCDHDRIILAGNLGMNPWQLILGMEKRNALGVSEEFKNMAKWLY
tara:strand:- start:815 stop:1504 length:690 start_codon:yes stop_codon:yes gene_type:complete